MLPRGSAESIAAIAATLSISHRETSTKQQWVPNEEQHSLWALLCQHDALFIAKPRKTGISTAWLLDDVLWTHAADDDGNKVRTVFAIDSDDKAAEHFERAERWCNDERELGSMLHAKPSRSPPRSLRFPGGSHIDFLSLGSSEPGRGGDIHRLHVTELPYAAGAEGAWHALRSACADNARIGIETTMTTLSPFVVDLWRGFRRDAATNKQIPIGTEFHRHFFRVTEQRSYRLPTLTMNEDGSSTHLLNKRDAEGKWRTATLTASDWAYALAEGFAEDQREAAAWWMLEALPNKAEGQTLTHLHDYPQLERHLFVATAGRYITKTPQVAPVVETVPVSGVSGMLWGLDVFVPPEDCSGHVNIAVDTAWGLGKTRSVVLAVDVRSPRKILAAFSSPLVEQDDLARIAQMARHHYGEAKNAVKCTVIIESNGAGIETMKQANKIGLPFTAMDQVKNHRDHGADACMRVAKRLIETEEADGSSAVWGPPELAEECDGLKREKNQFAGNKDICMTLGMALLKREEVGIRDTSWKTQRKDIKRVYVEDRMKEEAKRARGLR